MLLVHYMVSFNLYNIPKRKVLCLPGNRGSERLNNVTKNRHLQTAELDLNPSLSEPQVHVLPIIPYCTNDSPFRQFGQKEINVAASCSKAPRRSAQRSKSRLSSHSKAGRQARAGRVKSFETCTTGSKGNINTLVFLDLEGACPGASALFPRLQPKPLLALLRAALAHPYDSRTVAGASDGPRAGGVECRVKKATRRSSVWEGA